MARAITRRIDSIVQRYACLPFQWGVLDCCMFSFNVLRDLTDHDYAADFRGSYRGPVSARRIVRRHGGFVPLISQVVGSDIRPIWGARPGDLILLRESAIERDKVGAAVGIYDGQELISLTECGVDRGPVMHGRGCWHV